MVNCGYCNKELDRQVFCSDSHKVMYHRKTNISSELKPTEFQKKIILSKKISIIPKKKGVASFCQHGAMPSLCKFEKCRK